MEMCEMCRDLEGKSSSVVPHSDLRLGYPLFFGAPGRQAKVHDTWRCAGCGTDWRQTTIADADAPERWIQQSER